MKKKQSKESMEEYQNYLKSPQWKEIRERVMRRDGYVCQYCGAEKATSVHHWRYDNIFAPRMAELTSLCWPCHKSLHPKKDDVWLRGEDIIEVVS